VVLGIAVGGVLRHVLLQASCVNLPIVALTDVEAAGGCLACLCGWHCLSASCAPLHHYKLSAWTFCKKNSMYMLKAGGGKRLHLFKHAHWAGVG